MITPNNATELTIIRAISNFIRKFKKIKNYSCFLNAFFTKSLVLLFSIIRAAFSLQIF